MGLEVELVELPVGRVAVSTVGGEAVVDQVHAPFVVQTAALSEQRRIEGAAGARRTAVGEGDDDHAPRVVAHETVVHDRVVATAGDRHPGSDRARAGRAREGHVRVVVVVHVVLVKTQHVGAPATGGLTPAGQAPFCGGGLSPFWLLVSKPSLLWSNSEFCTSNRPPELEPE